MGIFVAERGDGIWLERGCRKGGQNVRLAAKLTGWRIDIKGAESENIKSDENLSEDDILEGGIVDDGTEA